MGMLQRLVYHVLQLLNNLRSFPDRICNEVFIPKPSLTAMADPAVFADPNTFAPERWLDDDQTANRHQYAFGIGGRMCVASHVASKALYTVFLHLIAHFKILPAEGASDIEVDPIAGLAVPGNHQAAPRARHVRFLPRNAGITKGMLSKSS